MSAQNFAPVSLFGGAIKAAIPEGFRDASDFRPVPDTQEVYVSMIENLDISIVIDINRRVNAPTDLEALDTHFEDVAGDQGHGYAIVNKESTILPKMPNKPTYTITGTTSARPREDQRFFTGILMTVVRLPEQSTDICITVNVPFNTPGLVEAEGYLSSPRMTGGGGGQRSEMLRAGVAVLEGVLREFEVLDWGLFLEDLEDVRGLEAGFEDLSSTQTQ